MELEKEIFGYLKNNPQTLFDDNIDIYYSQKKADGSWSIARPVD